MKKTKNVFLKFITPDNCTPDDGMIYWQNRVLRILLFSASVLGLFVYIPSFILSVKERLFTVAFIDTFVYAFILILFFVKRISYRIKALSLTAITYILGLVLLFTLKTDGAGPVWFFLFPVTAGILLGFRSSLICLLINAVTLALAGIISYSSLSNPAEAWEFILRWTVICLNFLVLNTLVTISLTSVFHGLNASFKLQVESKEKYRRIFENILDIYFEISLDGKILEISPSADKFFINLNQKSSGDRLFSEAPEEQVRTFFNLIKTRGEADNHEMDFFWAVGEKRTGMVNARLLTNELNQPVSIIGIIRDISQWNEINRENKVLEEKLNRSEKMESLGLLAGGVAHDLNNILSATVAYPDLILDQLPLQSPHRKSLEAIKNAGEKAAAILDDLLNLARRGIVSRDIVDFNQIIIKFLDSPEYGKMTVFHPGSRIVSNLTAGDSLVVGSSFHLHKLMMNLLSNALEAQPEGGEIVISTFNLYDFEGVSFLENIPRGDYFVLRVKDDGTGISGEDLSHIFEPFFTKKVMGRSGTGLGMAVVWGTVRDHKGFIDIKSEMGNGTTIEVFIPLSEIKSLPVEKDYNLSDYLGGGERVLVVDDLKEQRDINRSFLIKLNYSSTEVSSGEEALAYLKSNTVDVVLLDMIMGTGMDGMETYLKIREERPDQKVILLSGYTDNKGLEAILASGIKAYLKKPCSLKNLGLTLKRVLTE